MSPVPDSADLGPYLESDDVVDWRNPQVRSLAARLTAGLDGDTERARVLFEWVRDTIPHTNDVKREEVTCSATEVLAVGTGICYAKAHLLAALLRAAGIPAGFCYQVFDNPEAPPEDPVALHGLNGIYLESLGRWIRVDPRGNHAGVDAQFRVDEESLAFPELELLDNRVYARPLREVVEALRRYETRAELWPNLPAPPRTAGDAGTESAGAG